MGLPDVVDAIIADFADSGVTCPILYGPDHIAEHDEPPRIVIVPTGDTYGPPQYVQQNAFPLGDMADGQNPRTIATRYEGARATIWAKGNGLGASDQRSDYDALHDLINQFILSLHRVNPGNYTLSDGKTTEETRVVRLGYVYTLNFTVNVPIIDAPWPTETDVTQDSTIEMINPADDSVMASVEITGA